MKKWLIILGGLTLLSGCGVEKKRTPLPDINVINNGLTSSPSVLLRKQQTSCGSTSFLPRQLDLTLHFFLNGSIQNETQNFVSLFSGIKLQSSDSSVINESVFNMDVEIIPRGQLVQVKLHNKGESLTVCPEVAEFERDTVESAALNAAYVINKTNLAAKAADKNLILGPVGLIISPNIRTTYLQRSSDGSADKLRSLYQTDNAYYQPSSQTVTFLPHSEDWKAMKTGMSFWEVPMVGSHEYAHHIFQTLASPELAKKGNLRHICFGSPQKLVDRPEVTSEVEILTPNPTILTGYNEGFADLVSYYSLDDQERRIDGVPCLQVSRDVGSENFFDGTPKTFSKDALDTFVRPKSFRRSSCDQTDFKDAHAFGAIFAHNADSFLSQLTYSKTKKLGSILAWARAIKENNENLSQLRGEEYLKSIFMLFLRSSVKNLGFEMAPNCLRAEMIYPGISKTMNECTGL